MPKLWVDISVHVNVTSIFDQYATTDNVIYHKFDPNAPFYYWGGKSYTFVAEGLRDNPFLLHLEVGPSYANTTYQNDVTLTASELENDPNATQLDTIQSEYVPQ